MSEIIDRVTSAVLAEAYKTDGISLKVGVARAIARAAIEAMREPTEEMIDAGSHEAFMEHADGVWRDMIDAALTK